MHLANAKPESLKRTVRGLLRRPPAALAMLGLPGIALAAPTGEDVIRGRADIHRPDANNTVIDQHTERAVINWETFSVDADEFVLFNQPGASSIVLNRVLGGDPSRILGQMQANGQVFLLNPYGVFIADGASLDVQGFLGSTLDMDADDFMAGTYALTRNPDSPASASVVNDGQISAGPGGYVVLAGDFTENTGIISANAGTVALVSGNALTLDIEGDGLVSFTVDEATLADNAGVRNAGSLLADGGMVVMTAKVANNLVATAVNNEGLVRARSIEERNGEIFLVGNGGDVVNSGTLDADGDNADGGRIVVYGDRDVTLADGAVQTAAGDANHKGGMIRAIAEQHLDYQEHNVLRATGGTTGGFVEVSGHGSIAVRGTPDIGAGGTFFIDPSSITIYDGANTAPAGSVGTVNDAYIEAQLGLGVNVVLAASNSISANIGTSITTAGTGDLTIGIGTMSAGGGGVCFGMNSSLCQGPAPVFNPTAGGTNVNLANLALDIGGDLLVSAQNAAINLSNARAASVTLDAGSGGNISFNNLRTTGGSVTITAGNAGGNNIGSAGSLVDDVTVNTNGNFTLSNSVHATGYFQAYTTGGDIDITGNVTAGAANLSGNGINGITVGGNINVSSALTLTASNFSISGGNVSVGGAISANGSLDINAYGGSYGGGNINITGSIVNTATNATSLYATGSGSASGGSITVGGNINASGDVNMSAANGNPLVGAGANIIVGNVSGDAISITTNGNPSFSGAGNITAGNIVATDNVFINADFGSTHSFGDISARHIDAHFTPTIDGNISVSMGQLAANGVTSGNRDIVVELNRNTDGFSSSGALTINGANTQNGEAIFNVLADAPSNPVNGSFVANGAINAARFINIAAPDTVNVRELNAGTHVNVTTRRGNIDTRAINVSNGSVPASVFLEAGIDAPAIAAITVNGNITASGRANSQYPDGGMVTLRTNDGGSVTVAGNIGVTGTGRNFTNPDTGSTGFMGAGRIEIDTGSGGVVDTGNLGINAVGEGMIMVRGGTVSVGDIAMNITDGNITRSFNSSCGTTATCSLTIANAFAGGQANVQVDRVGTGGAFSFGNVNLDAGAAYFGAQAFSTIKGGSIAIAARGLDYTLSSNGTYEGNPASMTESGIGGGATVDLQASSGGTIILGGPVGVSGKGMAEVRLAADVIKTRGISANASAGTFERSGNPSGWLGGGIFDHGGGDGPRIDEGTIKGGFAFISLANGPAASTIDVAGDLSVQAPGHAHIDVNGGDVTIAGNITATGGRLRQDGSYSQTWFDSSAGSSVTEAGTIVSSYGNAGVDINANGNLVAGNITIRGPGVGGDIEGGNLRVGDLTLVGSGGSLRINETATYDNGTVETRSFDGPGQLSGLGIFATNAIETGAISIDAVGAGGMLLEGATIDTRSIGITVTDGSYSVLAPDVFGASVNDFTIGNVVFGIYGATANVNGDLALNGSRGVHFGGNATVGGDFSIRAGGTVTPGVPRTVQFTSSIGDPDAGDEIVLPATMNVRADNVTVETTNGSLNLAGAGLRATNAMTLAASRDIGISGVTLNAATLQMNAGGSIRNSFPPATINAGAAAIAANGLIDLGNTTLTVGSRTITGVNGDAEFLRLLAAEGIATPTGPNLQMSAREIRLGTLNFGGDYLFLQANTLSLGGAISTSDPELLLQLAPFAPGAGFTLEQSRPSGSGTRYVHDGGIDVFNAATVALGTTTHTGSVAIGANSEFVDIGDTNLFVLTRGTVTGLDKVLSTGIVKDLATLLGLGFNVPQTAEIDTSQDLVQTLNDTYGLEGGSGEDEEEGDEEGEDTDTETDVEEEDESLIRQETSDEEMMCR